MSITFYAYDKEQLSNVQKENIRDLLVTSYAQYEPYYKDPQIWKNYVSDIRGAVDHPHIEKLITAQIDEQFVGSVALFKGSKNAYNRPELNIESYIIRFLAVDPEKRGKKIAEQLVDKSLRWIHQQGGNELVLHTSDKMQSAIKLYERMGFKRAPQYEFFLGDTYIKSYRLPVTK